MTHHLVTGGAGFLGSSLVRRLLREGHKVTVLDRLSRGKADRVPADAQILKGDIRDRAFVRHAVFQADVVWHLAYVQGTRMFYENPKDVIDVALTGIVNVLRACDRKLVKPELMLVSSSETYQVPPTGMFPTDETVPLSVPDVKNPRYSYGGGKIAQEIATLAYASAGAVSRALIVRPHNVYGPDMGFEHVIPEFAMRAMDVMDEGSEFHIQGTGLETRSFCHVLDCVDGLMVAYERGGSGEVYHLGNPAEEHNIRHLAELVLEWFQMSGRRGSRLRDVEVVPGKLPEGSPPRRLPDIAKLGALGFNPSVPLRMGLDQTLSWYFRYGRDRQRERAQA